MAMEKRESYMMQQIYVMLISLVKNLDKIDSRVDKRLTARQFITMLAIRHAPEGEATMAGVAKRLRTTKQNMNQQLSSLEKKGYIAKATGRRHGRGAQICVTDAGVEALREFTVVGMETLRGVFVGFTVGEMETLLTLLRKLHGAEGMAYPDFESQAYQLVEGD